MYDAIIVGARCAGASTALHLARNGYSVLVLDRDPPGSDMTASTHMIWQGGVALLKRWGLLDRVAASNCPPMEIFNLDMGEFVLRGNAPASDGVLAAYAPRRYVLDKILLEAAIEAGAEFREGCSVLELLSDGDSVTGVRFSDKNGAEYRENAKMVIGADGRNSTVARSVEAPSFDEQSKLQGTFYAYFSDFPLNEMEFYSRPGRMVYGWSTNDGLSTVGICARYDDFRSLNRDPEQNFYDELRELAPAFCERAQSAKRETRWLSGATRNFRRKPWGSGWALVGDAGLTMDPITASGISNAMRDGELLANAVHDGFSGSAPMADALAGFERTRDEASMPLYEFTLQMGRLDVPTDDEIALFTALRDNPEDTSAYFGVFAQTVSPTDFFAPDNVQRIIEQAGVATA
jgi:2-polyprenyl-6-methoxyphenol hydroxylase-like FAD-dependent oxidoreductase